MSVRHAEGDGTESRNDSPFGGAIEQVIDALPRDADDKVHKPYIERGGSFKTLFVSLLTSEPLTVSTIGAKQ